MPADQNLLLQPFEQQLLDGATAGDEVVARYFTAGTVTESARAVAYEISLLQKAKRSGVDEYIAYRLGVLSQIVADLNQPFGEAEPRSGYDPEEIAELRRQYELDVDVALQGVEYGYKRRKPVYDAEAYFLAARRYLQHAEYFLAQDYMQGEGFGEYGQRSLNLYFDNAVNAVADVWFTVLGNTRLGQFVEPQSGALRQFRIKAVRYFLEIGQDKKAADTVAELENEGLVDVQTEKRIADAYFETSRQSRAIDGYLRVLEQEPNWPEVRSRVSNYYYALGAAYMKGGLLEEAKSAFQNVLTSDPQFRPARFALDTTIGLIAARNERLSQLRSRIRTAQTFETRAARSADDRNYAGAIGYLRQASGIYSEVTSEFRREYGSARRKLAAINQQIARFSDTIIREAIELDNITEQMVLGTSIQQAARKHAARFVDEVTRTSHNSQSKRLQQKFVQQEKEQL